MSVELGCAGLWLAFTTAVVDGITTDAIYRCELRNDGFWTTTATFPRIDCEADATGAFRTLREALEAVNGFRSEPYFFAN